MRTYALLILALAVLPLSRAQNLIFNGGFELPGLPSGQDMLLLTNGSTYITGWSIIDDGVGQRPFYGNGDLNDAMLNGEYGLVLNQGSGVRTVFRTEVGAFYELSLFVRPDDCRSCVTPAPLRVTISGNSANRPIITEVRLPITPGWFHHKVQFYSTHTVNNLELYNSSSTPDSKRFAIDDVAIQKVDGAVLGVSLRPVVSVEGDIGAKYQIQGATNLNAPMWNILTNLILSNSPTLFLDTSTTAPHRIYRAIRVP